MQTRDMMWDSETGMKDGDLAAMLACADLPSATDTGHFIASGLRAARGAQSAHRRTILSDVANVLQCSTEELGFLFMDPVMAANDSDPVAMPDFRASMRAAL